MTTAGPAATRQLNDAIRKEVVRQHAHYEAGRLLAEQRAAKIWTPPTSRSGAAELALPDEPLVYTIDGMHVRGHNALLAAQFKAGKTTLLLNLLRSMADRVPFLGYDVHPSTRRIAVWNYEVDERQYRQWLRRVGIVNVDAIEIMNLRGRTMPLHVDHVRRWTATWLRDVDATTWILDPAARAIVGWPGARETENSNTAVAEFLDTLDQLKFEGGVEDLFLAHHTGRAAQTPGAEHGRGATRWDDWPDVRQVLVKHEDGGRYFYANGRGVDVPEFKLAFDPATLRLSHANGSRQENRSRSYALLVVDALLLIGDGKNKTTVKAALRGVANDRKDAAITYANEQGMIDLVPSGKSLLINLRRDHPEVADRIVV